MAITNEDVRNVAAYFSRRIGYRDAIVRHLQDIEGWFDIKQDVRNRIEEQAEIIYRAGYLHAVKRRD